MLQKLILLTFTVLFLSTPLSLAQEIVTDGHVQAQLISENQSIQPGRPLWVAVHLKMDLDWHVYWKNPGDSGLPVKIEWELPKGFIEGPIQWPTPQKIEQPPLTNYGYEGEVFLLTQINPPVHLPDGIQSLKAKINWLVCKVECIPGQAEVSLSLPVKQEPPQPNPLWIKAFSDTRFKLALETSDWAITAHNQEHSLILQFNKHDRLSQVYFFPEREDIIDHAGIQTFKETPEGYVLSIPRSSLSSKPLEHLKGIVVSPDGWRGAQSEQALSVDIPMQAAVTHHLLKQQPLSLIVALVFAFLGGLILNLMPCVLPVLSLKILSLIKQAGVDKTKLRMHGLVFTAGVVVSFWILVGLLIILKSTGQQIGWGFQFQSPLFLILLSTMFLIFALNLFGAFEILLPVQIQTRKPSGLWGVFLNGVLATLTATPCTAPFMGTALGFALTQSAFISFFIFTALGLGMSFPYILLSFFPALLKFLPKPGPWMIQFKKFLGVLLLGTVLWLWWILCIQVGWIKEAPPTVASSSVTWQAYSPALIDELRVQQRIILIDFTAKWCLTCQVNERIALSNPKVIEKFKQLNVALVKADWTSKDASITRALAEFGKNSIPLYVLYTRGSADPILLPEIITAQTVLEALDKIDQ